MPVARVAELAQTSPDSGESARVMAVGIFGARVVPALHGQPGFGGCLILVRRAGGRCFAVTLWDTEEHARLAEARLEQQRRTGEDGLDVPFPLSELFDVVAAPLITPR